MRKDELSAARGGGGRCAGAEGASGSGRQGGRPVSPRRGPSRRSVRKALGAAEPWFRGRRCGVSLGAFPGLGCV